MRTIVRIANLLSVALFLATAFPSLAQAKPPNIVVFISDDLGRLETSVYGSTDVKTPNMAKLAAMGMTFNSAYVASPSCCPNRFSLLTGLMPARHGAHPNHSQVKPGTQFLPPLLQQQGYTIASFGKVAHNQETYPGLDHNSKPPINLAQHVHDWFDNNKVEGPICLMVGDRRPHVPWIKESIYDPKTLTLPPYFIDTPETRRHWARYLTDVTGMDQELGRVLDIAKEKFGDDFIFVFTSDHGGQWPFGKWNLYDSGTRIPMIVAWPGQIKPGSRTDAMVSWVDILPTLIEVAGGTVPSDIDGKSFAKVLTGKVEEFRDKIFTTHTGDGQMNIYPIRSVRVGDYKYIHNLLPDAWHTNHGDRLADRDGASAYWRGWNKIAESDPDAAAILKKYYTRPKEELFDLANDPLEQHNLADDPNYQAQLKELRADLKRWTTAQKDELQPHRKPYLRSEPLPEITDRKSKK